MSPAAPAPDEHGALPEYEQDDGSVSGPQSYADAALSSALRHRIAEPACRDRRRRAAAPRRRRSRRKERRRSGAERPALTSAPGTGVGEDLAEERNDRERITRGADGHEWLAEEGHHPVHSGLEHGEIDASWGKGEATTPKTSQVCASLPSSSRRAPGNGKVGRARRCPTAGLPPKGLARELIR